MIYSPKIREEELKNRVAADFFAKYDCAEIIKDIDFAVKTKHEYLLWAEAKAAPSDILLMLTQGRFGNLAYFTMLVLARAVVAQARCNIKRKRHLNFQKRQKVFSKQG